MVSDDLLQKLKALRDGEGERSPSDALLLCEAMKQLAAENEDIKEEVEDMDTILVQFVWTDVDYKYWVKLGEGKVDYGEGEADNPSVTMKATSTTWAGMGAGEIESTSAYMSGDLQIDGNLQDAIAYGEINNMVGEVLSELRGE
ncbi:MAG: SCP2 sterol-binding domain-containing protein [Candidatus Lokiarchaeota archaeon]|nr:SCP2 sterol-binding domain-containing protein [Candidatus Lokiarchaeota archaeon]